MLACQTSLRNGARHEARKSVGTSSGSRQFQVGTPSSLSREKQARKAGCSSSSSSSSNSHKYLHARTENQDKLAQREFFFDVLNASATRRDAKAYLSRFKVKSPVERKVRKPVGVQSVVQRLQEQRAEEQTRLQRSGVNLGELYRPTRAAAESPTFLHQAEQETDVQRGAHGEMHVALVCMRSPHLMEEDVLEGIALTLSQLVKLDMQIIVVLNCDEELLSSQSEHYKAVYERQAERIAAALEHHNKAGARYVDSAMSVADCDLSTASIAKVRGSVSVNVPKLVTMPLQRGAIPIVPAIAYTPTLRTRHVPAADVVLALTRYLAGLTPAHARPAFDTSVDRIIILDPLGGLPSEQREDKAHVFVNLEQEYDEITQELKGGPNATHYLNSLKLARNCLALLPPASSALMLSPEEAATSARSTASTPGDSIGISTRRQKNPLIHNLLTNKPVISSSLPVARLSPAGICPTLHASDKPAKIVPTRNTIIKRGMPLIVVPHPHTTVWAPPAPGESTIDLANHPDVNLPRLVDLIEDSFRRPLDVRHYLHRVHNRVAGVIVAGEYEGGAILTWEMPPHLPNDPSHPDYDHTRLVPYLDKFAVLQKSQGSSGVADIVFQAMVRSCFPQGVCWRSRQTNPVNKWYFERAQGIWKLHNTEWTMFWTDTNLVQDRRRWEDYAAVCRSIAPSWADGKPAE